MLIFATLSRSTCLLDTILNWISPIFCRIFLLSISRKTLEFTILSFIKSKLIVRLTIHVRHQGHPRIITARNGAQEERRLHEEDGGVAGQARRRKVQHVPVLDLGTKRQTLQRYQHWTSCAHRRRCTGRPAIRRHDVARGTIQHIERDMAVQQLSQQGRQQRDHLHHGALEETEIWRGVTCKERTGSG